MCFRGSFLSLVLAPRHNDENKLANGAIDKNSCLCFVCELAYINKERWCPHAPFFRRQQWTCMHVGSYLHMCVMQSTSTWMLPRDENVVAVHVAP
jgi:hypothetical protein